MMQIIIDARDCGNSPIKLLIDTFDDFVTINLPYSDDIIYIPKMEWAMLLEAGRGFLMERIEDNA